MKYRKKPVVIEAIKFTGKNNPFDALKEAWKTKKGEIVFAGEQVAVQKRIAAIQTLEGWHEVKENDYVIKGIKGELYPCKPDIFAATYEKVEEQADAGE